MKRSALVKHLEKNGCYLVREGSNHSIYINPANQKQTAVGRHQELDNLLCKKCVNNLKSLFFLNPYYGQSFLIFYICPMLDLNKTREILSLFKPELIRKYPIASIGLFGSIVRDDFTEHSDIDIIVEFNGSIGIEFITLADELENKLQRKVDLVSRQGIKPRYLEVIDPHIIYV